MTTDRDTGGGCCGTEGDDARTNPSDIKSDVRERYGKVATTASSCCGGGSSSPTLSTQVGYSDEEVSSVPEGADLGLGCGNPVAIASLEPGHTVLDLGSGAGFDCFLAARQVGESGHVIGVDMTDEMLARARANAEKGDYANVEFRRGEIENLPVDDASVDVVISNCVINLSPDKPRVFAEMLRVLEPGGRFFVSDLTLLEPLPDSVRSSAAAYSACVAGALLRDEYLELLRAAGFEDVRVTSQSSYPLDALAADPSIACLTDELGDVPREDIERAARAIVSIRVTGRKAAR